MAGTKAGSAWYELSANDSKLRLALASADKQIVSTGDKSGKAFATRFSAQLGSIKSSIGGLAAGLGAAFAATKVVSFFGDAIGAASDLNEEIDKSSVVFGAAAPMVQAFADSAADIGLAKAEALGAAGAFGNMFRTIGFSGNAAADMSVRMVRLASDMGSFNNEDPTEMLDKLRSGLSGEAEPLRRFGVLISDAAVKAFAYKNGIAATGIVLTEAQKVQARYGLILEQTALQHGNFAATAGSLANTQRTLAADMTNLSAKIGGFLLPVITALARFAIDVLIPAIEKIGVTVGFLLPGILAVATVIGVTLIPAFVAWAAAAATAAAATIVAMAPVLIPLAAIVAAVAAVSLAFNALSQSDALATFAMNFGTQGTQVHALADSMGVDFDTLKQRIAARMGESGQSFDQVVAGMKATAADAAAAVPARMEETMREYHKAIVDGGPVISAEAGKVAGMLPSEIQRKVDSVRQAGMDSVVAFAAGILEKQNDPMLAMEALTKANEDALTRGEEIARLKGQLTSSELANGLDDSRPEVRLAAQAARADIVDRLSTLGVEATGWGSGVGWSMANGITSVVPVVRNAAGELANAVRGQVGILSEPKDAASPLHGVTKWGGNIAKTLAGGMYGELGSVRSAAGALAASLVPVFGAVPRLGLMSPMPNLAAISAPAAMGFAGSGGSTTGSAPIHVEIHLHDMLGFDASPIQMERVRRVVTDGVAESLERRGRIDRGNPHRY